MQVSYAVTADPVGTLKAITGLFHNIPQFIIEAVENSFAYDSRKKTIIKIYTPKKTGVKFIRIVDTSDGMSPQEIKGDFLNLHVSKKRQEDDRNEFGIGVKASAFAISTTLRVETCKGGIFSDFTFKQNEVKVKAEQKTCKNSLHGTTLTVRPKQKIPNDDELKTIILAALRYKVKNNVYLNDVILNYKPLKGDISKTIPVPSYLKEWIGGKSVLKLIYTANALPKCFKGVAIICGKKKHVSEQNYKGALQNSPLCDNISGELFTEYPKIKKDRYGRSAIPVSRGALNIEHEGVSQVKEWINKCLEDFKNSVANVHKERQNSVLGRQMENIIGEMLKKLVEKVPSLIIKNDLPGPVTACKPQGKKEIIEKGKGNLRVTVAQDGMPLLDSHIRTGEELGRKIKKNKHEKTRVIFSTDGAKARIVKILDSGGLKVRFGNLGAAGRAEFDEKTSTMVVNLDDHCLKKVGLDSVSGKRTAQEIILGEFCLKCAEWDKSHLEENQSIFDFPKNHNTAIRIWQRMSSEMVADICA